MSDLAKKEAKKERADRAKGAGRESFCEILLTVQVCLYVVSGRITFENVLQRRPLHGISRVRANGEQCTCGVILRGCLL